jgi:hypothetical protein
MRDRLDSVIEPSWFRSRQRNSVQASVPPVNSAFAKISMLMALNGDAARNPVSDVLEWGVTEVSVGRH